MESRDPLDDLIAETLRERLGPPPSSEVWQRIAREIAPPRPPLWRRLRASWAAPLVQSAMMVAALFFLLAQPALYWQHQPRPAGPETLHVSSYSRPLPAGELPTETLAFTPSSDLYRAVPPRLPVQ